METPIDARVPAPEVRFCEHSETRMRQYRVQRHHVLGALGPAILDREGKLMSPAAAADHQDRLLHAPSPGRPVLIGRSFPSRRYVSNTATRSVLLATTPGGRRLHIVCVPHGPHRLDVVSLWDPDDEVNRGRWQSHGQLPTTSGALEGVPTVWSLGRPEALRRRRFRPMNPSPSRSPRR